MEEAARRIGGIDAQAHGVLRVQGKAEQGRKKETTNPHVRFYFRQPNHRGTAATTGLGLLGKRPHEASFLCFKVPGTGYNGRSTTLLARKAASMVRPHAQAHSD